MTNLRSPYWIKKLALCVASILLAQGVLACSILPPQFKGLDTKEYIFYGEVTGYSALKTPICEPFTAKPQCATAWGLELSVLSSVQFPRTDATRVQLYMFSHGSDCSLRAIGKEQVQQFTKGARYKFIARQLSAVEEPLQPGLLLLDASSLVHGRAILIPPGQDISALRESRVDYATEKRRGFYERGIDFEFKKDLVRLHASPSKQLTLTTLRRLADFDWYVWDLDSSKSSDHFMTLVRQHLSDARSIKELQRLREAARYFKGDLNWQQAHDLLLTHARDGEPEFQFHLGMHLAKSDPQSAVAWLQRASSQGFVAADFQLGKLYDQITLTAKVTERKQFQKMADQAYLRAARKGVIRAEKGDAWAALMLAEMHHSGLGGLGSPYSDRTIERYVCLGMKNKPRGYPTQWLHKQTKCS